MGPLNTVTWAACGESEPLNYYDQMEIGLEGLCGK